MVENYAAGESSSETLGSTEGNPWRTLCHRLTGAVGKLVRVVISTEDPVVVPFDGRGTAPPVAGARRGNDDLNLCTALPKNWRG